MFDIGFSELLLIAVVGLIVIGPKRLPETVRFAGFWLGRLRRNISRARTDMEREFGLDEVRRDLYNQELLGQLEDQRVRNQLENERLAAAERIKNPLPLPIADARQGELFAESPDTIEWLTPGLTIDPEPLALPDGDAHALKPAPDSPSATAPTSPAAEIPAAAMAASARNDLSGASGGTPDAPTQMRRHRHGP